MLFLSYLALVLPVLVAARPMKPFRLDQRGIRDMRNVKQLANGTYVHKRACAPTPPSGGGSTPPVGETHSLPAEGIRGVNVGSWFLIEVCSLSIV